MKLFKIAGAIALPMLSSPAFASNALVLAVPTAWRLENQVGSGVVAYYTGSPCTYGRIQLVSTATADDANRFWSLIMTAKASGKKVMIYYDTTTCDVQAFGLAEE